MNEYVHFLEEVLAVYEEENRGKTQKYLGKVSFNSKVLENQDKIDYTGAPGAKIRAPTKQAAGPNRDSYKTATPPQIVKDERKVVVQQVSPVVPKSIRVVRAPSPPKIN